MGRELKEVPIRVSQANIDHRHLYVTELLKVPGFLPADFAEGGGTVEVEAVGLDKTFTSARERNRFRNRQFPRAFYRFHNVKDGDEVVLEKVSERRYRLRPAAGPVLPPPPPPPPLDESQAFRLEKHLEDFLAHNWALVPELREWELIGNQYPTGVGPIDLLARHRTRRAYLVVELKREQTSDETIGQICRYMAWIDAHLATEGEAVEGIVVAHEQDEKIRYAVRRARDVSLLTYEVAFRLKPVGT